MAFFDRNARRIVVRVVYDGPAFAGKTTNLEQLRGFFSTLRRGELISPETLAGRTVFFDWMHLDGGLVAGYALRCQLITVPGQAVLTQRRLRILRGADVVVFVCEGTQAGAVAARPMLRGLRSALEDEGRGDLPIVVQANKQDKQEALSGSEILRLLDLPQETPIVAATSHLGAGVKETAVLAIRAAATRVQRQLFDGTVADRGEVETPEELHAQLLAAENEGAAGLRESRAGAVFAFLDGDAAASVQESASAPVALPVVREPDPEFTFPNERVATGSVWPMATGRAVLRELAELVPVRISAPGEQPAVFRAGSQRLVTHSSWVFPSLDDGRVALVGQVRRRMALGALRPAAEVVALQEERDGCRLWRLTPRLLTVEGWLTRAREQEDEALAATALGGMGLGVALLLRLLGPVGAAGRIGPRNFGILEGRVLFLDEDETRSSVRVGESLVDPIGASSTADAAFEAYLGVLCENLDERMPFADTLLAELESIEPRDARAFEARRRLTQALSGARA